MWQRWLMVAAALAVLPAANPRSAAASGTSAVYGGVTAQGWPVVFDVRPGKRLVARATIGLELTCSSGQSLADHDRYARFPLSPSGRFSERFGPTTVATGPDATAVFSGSLVGRIKNDRITGVWRYVRVNRDAAGAVTDTCDSGRVPFSARAAS